MVDSIAVNTPSGGSGTGTPSPANFFHGPQNTGPHSHLRSTKRVKLSPKSDFYGEGDGAGAMIARPKLFRKDYVGESQHLMQKIKQARDFSTISTVASAQSGSPATTRNGDGASLTKDRFSIEPMPASRDNSSFPADNTPSSQNASNSDNKAGTYASLYRQQGDLIMAQLKSDLKGPKRMFSSDTDASCSTVAGDKDLQSHLPSLSQESLSDNKENASQHHRGTFSTSSNFTASRARQKNTPRKLRRLSSSDGLNHEQDVLADGVAELRIDHHQNFTHMQVDPIVVQMIHAPNPANSLALPSDVAVPGKLAPPAPSHPSGSTNEDLNRFVSSSTASGTTLASGGSGSGSGSANAQSFVKHPGPVQIRRITPGDVPALPERVGKMVFDRNLMKWVKADDPQMRDFTGVTDADSEDPFMDIESFGESGHVREAEDVEEDAATRDGMSRIEELSEVEDEEEMELASFSFDDPSGAVVQVMTGVETDIDNDETTDSDDDDLEEDGLTETTDVVDNGFDTDDDYPANSSGRPSPQRPGPKRPSPKRPSPKRPSLKHQSPSRPSQRSSIQRRSPSHPTTLSTPYRASSLPPSATPIIRSALKSNSATPNQRVTPMQKMGHKRSVSFSDGKRDGPIRGLTRSAGDDSQDGMQPSAAQGSDAASTWVQSIRSKRIAAMMGDLEDSDTDSDENESPSKTSSSGRPEELQPLTARRPSTQLNAVAGSSKGVSPGRVFSRNHAQKTSPKKTNRSNVTANATFLTECSFGVAHDRLVQVITDVQPFEPRWEDLSFIDLASKNIESVARLKEFLPRLDSLNLNKNQISWLSGVPATVRTLSVASNSLTSITSYSHLLNLENLDISHNDIDSLRQLACLRHLRELRADANKISTIDGLQRMDGLVKLSLQGNCIRSVDLAQYRWTRLEMLNMSQNRLDNISGLASLPSLIALNIDDNALGELDFTSSMPKLRILRVSGNRLHQLNLASVPNLRTLYADNNSLASLVKTDRLTKLENLSLRNQSGRGLNLLTRDVRDVKRLYLSGNPLKGRFLEVPCYNLVYLELAACRLTSLPEDMARLAPNLRVLNLNYNFLEDARPLGGLERLKKLTIIGSRLKGTKPLIRLLQGMPDVEMLDFRMNPCTLGWYLPLLVKDVPGALQPSESGGSAVVGKGEKGAQQAWQELDSKFRRDLPDEFYIGRLAYRGLVMRACPRIRMLDGVEVSEKERVKAHHLLVGILGKTRKSKGKEVAQ